MLVGIHEDLETRRLSDGAPVNGGAMKLGMLVLLVALVAAPACGGGGGGSDSGVGGSPGPVAAGFIADQPSPGASTVAMLQATKNNDVVNVYVTLTGTSGVFGVAFDAIFDPAQATYLGFTKGAAMEAGGNVPNYTVDGSSNPGRIIVGVARTNGTATDITTTKAILTLQFRVKQPGTNQVTLENGVVVDAQSTPQPIPNMLWYAGALTGV
jgi:hypothetical protein